MRSVQIGRTDEKSFRRAFRLVTRRYSVYTAAMFQNTGACLRAMQRQRRESGGSGVRQLLAASRRLKNKLATQWQMVGVAVLMKLISRVAGRGPAERVFRSWFVKLLGELNSLAAAVFPLISSAIQQAGRNKDMVEHVPLIVVDERSLPTSADPGSRIEHGVCGQIFFRRCGTKMVADRLVSRFIVEIA